MAKVSITKTISVYPRDHPPQTHQANLLSLSNLDRKCPVLMYLVFFYRSPPPHQHLSEEEYSLFTSLKMGLEETLSVWYPAAGRLSLNPATGKLDLVCNNSGALLVEAVTQVEISDLGDLSQYNTFFENLVFKPPFSGNLTEIPLVVAQVTKFGCGGYALGVGTNHSLFDGLSNFDFLSAWASKTTGGRADGEVELVEPVHERGRLLIGHEQTQQQSTRPGDKDQVIMTRILAFDHLYQLIKQAAASTKCIDLAGKLVGSKSSDTSQNHFVLKTFCVRSSMVGRLKSMVTSMSDISCSSFEVVAAHLWKARTKALGTGKERRVCLQFAVDTRKKLVPPLPRGFSGNAYVLSSVSWTSGELNEASLVAIVEKIKEAKRAVTDEYIRAYLKALEASQSSLPPLPELTMISDWRRTPYQNVDFGLGSAVYASPLATPFQQAAYFMQNPNEVGGIDVRIGLLQQHVHAFSHYFLTML